MTTPTPDVMMWGTRYCSPLRLGMDSVSLDEEEASLNALISSTLSLSSTLYIIEKGKGHRHDSL